MKSRLQNLIHACAFLFLALTVSIATAAGPAGPGTSHQQHVGRSRAASDGHVFPFLRWLRDSVVEVVFGRPKSRQDTNARPWETIHKRYRDDVVLRFNVTNSEEEGHLSSAADTQLLDVWEFTPDYVDIRVHKDDVAGLMSLLPDTMQPTALIQDVAAAVWATYPSESRRSRKNSGIDSEMLDRAVVRALDGIDNIFFQDYQPLSVITNWLRLLEAMFPSYVELISIGKSYEGRDIPAVRVGQRTAGGPDEGPRKTILVTGGIHAREWISTSTVNYLLWSFITAYGKEHLITKLLDHFDIVFMPVLNPDGYEYTWTKDRLWRKSRQQTNMRYCRGLDLDHAFGYEWDAAKHQSDPCSESYGGDQPFQAVEASELAAWAKNETENNIRFIGFLDLHSYSQQVLFPYSYTCAIDPPNRESLEELAVGLAKAIRISSGEFYSVTSACEGAVARAYSASDSLPRIESGGGSAIDWFYHELNARFSYQIKLRDTGSYGFLLPPKHIVPTGEEMFHAMKYFGDFLLGNNGIEKFSFSGASEDDNVDYPPSMIENEEMIKDLKRRKTR